MLLRPLVRSAGTTVWCLDLTGRPAGLKNVGEKAAQNAAEDFAEQACVYAVVLYDRGDTAPPFVYVGQSTRLADRIRGHLSAARIHDRAPRDETGALARRLAAVHRRLPRLLVVVLETAPADEAARVRLEIAWQLAAALDGLDVAAGRLTGPGAAGAVDGLRQCLEHALTLDWPQRWLDALAPWFRVPQGPGARVLRLSEARAARLVAQPPRVGPAPAPTSPSQSRQARSGSPEKPVQTAQATRR